MLNKKIMMLAILIVSLFAVSAVSAADNATADVVNVNDIADDDIGVENESSVDESVKQDSFDDKLSSPTENQEILGASPPYSAYSVSVSDVSMNYGSKGYIYVSYNPAPKYSYTYTYNFYLKIYNSNNVLKVSKQYSGTATSRGSITHTISANSLASGVYTIKIVNSLDSHVMDTAKLTVNSASLGNSPPRSAYSVRVQDTSIGYGKSGSIIMSITPAASYTYKYDYYLKVYDSDNNQKISKRYYSTSSSNSITYNIGSNELSPGIYSIRIENYHDNIIMNLAVLTIVSVPYSAYSVGVSNTSAEYSSGGVISMSITPASSSYKYRYDYYLKVYDSSNALKISQRYSDTSSAYSKTYTIGSNSLTPGDYTIKIINTDNHVMDTATLTVMSVPYSAYSVRVSDTSITYGKDGSISMSISPAASGYGNVYDYYLKVYDSGNVEKISQRYSGTSSAYSKTYDVGGKSLAPGVYTIKIVNYRDNQVMDTAVLTVLSVPYSAYSVSVSDVSLDYGSSGSIPMSISPASSSYYYKYDYYLKVYDSNNVEKLSQRYYSTSSASSKTYNLASYALEPGKYTVKILNNVDNHVMSTATLSVEKITLETGDLVGKCDGIIEYKVRASLNGEYKSGLNVDFECNGGVYDAKTDRNGYATLKIHLKAGTYDIKTECGNAVNNNKITVNRVFVANKYKDAYVKSLNGYYGGKNKIKYGWKGNLEGYFKIFKGKKLLYKTKFNSNGNIDDYFKYVGHNAVYKGSAIKNVGKYRAVITNKGGKVLAKSTINIKKSPTHIKVNSFKALVGSKKTINVHVYDKFNSKKNVAGAVKAKINGKTYKAKVKKGLAKLKNVKFSSKTKTYKYTIKFIGNKNFKGSAKKFKVSVRKLTSKVRAYCEKTRAGNKNTLYGLVAIETLSGDYIKAKGGTVKFVAAGNTYYAKVKNGIAKVKIRAPYSAGTYKCKVSYLGGKTVKGSSWNFKMVVKKPASKYKIITTYAEEYWIVKHSGPFTVKTIIWDMTAGFRAPYKYIDTTLYKYGSQVRNSKYVVNYQINGRWTGWADYGTTSTAHHRFLVPDGAYVGQIKVKVHK
ncbi:hypothetical protein [Methanobrevibacter sp.]|uniref:hypothetical protein n=1 Tax=Methanobrevibacter sp. TaxID=66852 RepID=UPI0039758F8D